MHKLKKTDRKLAFKYLMILISPLLIFLMYLSLPYIFCDIAAKYYINKGNYLKAEAIYWKSLSIRQKLDPMEPLAICDDYKNLARLYIKQKKFSQARYCYEQIVDLHENKGYYNTNIHNLVSLGSLYGLEKDYKNAERCYLLALERAKRYYGKNDYETNEIESIVKNFYKFKKDKKYNVIFIIY